MSNLNHEQVIELLINLLEEDITNTFKEQLKIAGDHGYPNFIVRNSKGREVQVFVDWNKEADVLSYSINKEDIEL